MTPEQIKAILNEVKSQGLTGGLLKQMQTIASDPKKKETFQRKTVKDDLALEAKTGLQQTLGPIDLMTPGLGVAVPAAMAAVGLGTELGQAIKQGYVSNQNFDNVAMAGLGLTAMPLIGRKGQGKLYSRAIEAADEQGIDLTTATPTFLSRWFKKNDIKPAEQKEIMYAIDFANDNPGVSVFEALQDTVNGQIARKNKYGLPDYTTVTFPNIAKSIQRRDGKLSDEETQAQFLGKLNFDNILIQPVLDVLNFKGRTQDHWEGKGPIHARIGLGHPEDVPNPVGILAEVQSDYAKGVHPSELPQTTFLSDYPNVATKQSLLELMQKATEQFPGKDLDFMWPAGKLQRDVNKNTSTAYDKIYDKRVTAAVKDALGENTPINPVSQVPFSPLRIDENALTPLQMYQQSLEIENARRSRNVVPLDTKVLQDIEPEHHDIVKTLLGYHDYEISPNAPGYPDFLDAVKNYIKLKKADVPREISNADEPLTVYEKHQDAIKAAWEKQNELRDAMNQKDTDEWLASIRKITDKYNNQRSTRIDYPGLAHEYFDLNKSNEIWDKASETSKRLLGNFDGGLASYVNEMLQEDAIKKHFSQMPTLTPRVFSTTIPSDTVKRLAKEGLPLWMLPIGFGISSQIPYNKESNSKQ